MSFPLLIHARDPIVARDGRPFGSGQTQKMRSVPWPYPQMVAGSLRSLLGKLAGSFHPEALLQSACRGPLPWRNNQLYFPTPSDLVFQENRVLTARPLGAKPGEFHCDLPPSAGDSKPAKPPAFVSAAVVAQYSAGGDFPADPDCMEPVEAEERTHVGIDPDSYSHRESILFVTAGLPLTDPLAMIVAPAGPYAKPAANLRELHPLGGDRRLASWRSAPESAPGWTCPESVRKALLASGESRVRLTLATPAVWSGGWRPAWASSPEGAAVPGTKIELRLVGACVDRWKPVSGYRLVSTDQEPQGIRPVRWMAPAGSTYFFEVTRGSPAALADLWLQPVCDSEEITQDARDGFGLGLWGVWRPHA